MPEAHARLGPSNHRWPHCPGSIREEAAYPDISGEAAIDGTGSHYLLEMCLENNCRAEVYEGQVIMPGHHEKPLGWVVHRDRIDRVQMALDYLATRVQQLRAEYPNCRVRVESESRSDPGRIYNRKDWWGTCDITITVLDENDIVAFMEVADYKDGRGWVSAEDNSQLQSYLLGKLCEYVYKTDFRPENAGPVHRMTIIQPKTLPVIRHQDIQLHDLFRRGNELAAAAKATDDPKAPLVPDGKGGKGWCQWCKHKSNCVALNETKVQRITVMDSLPVAAEGTSLIAVAQQIMTGVHEMSTSDLSAFMDAEPALLAVFDKAREEIENRINAGETVSGWAIEPGRGSNVWALPEEEIVKKLKSRRLKNEEIYPKKLISPAQVLKLSCLTDDQKKKIENELITFKAGSDKLQRVAKKEVEKPTAQELFGEVIDSKPVEEAPDFTEAPNFF